MGADERDGNGAKSGPLGRLVPGGVMTTERPLDALLPELRLGRALRASPIHPRVLEVDVEGHHEWVFACWRDPGGTQTLHRLLRPLIEATLLAELSRPASLIGAGERRIECLRLIVFEPVEGGVQSAVQAFGMRPVEYVAEQYLSRLAALANEAAALGVVLPQHPDSVFEARVSHAGGTRGRQLQDLQDDMTERLGDDVWGATPGGPSRLLEALLRPIWSTRLTPTLAGLRQLESWLLPDAPGAIRWLPPLLFQALADFIGVVAEAIYQADMAWAECRPDETGLAPPPLLRAQRSSEPFHIPVGLHLLRWCLMPRHADEVVPSLADWLASLFESETS